MTYRSALVRGSLAARFRPAALVSARLVSAGLFATGLVGLCASAARADFTVEPGYLYAPADVNVRQFTPDLQLVATALPGGGTGAAITHDGLFLYEAYRTNVAGLPDGCHLMAMDHDGTLVHELSLVANSLNRVSGIGIGSDGTIYAAANDGVHRIAADFSTNTVLPISFGRASGLAVAPNDWLYVTDQNTDNIKIINSDFQLVGTIPTARVPLGATFGPDGMLYYTDNPFQTPDGYIGRLVKVNPATLEQTPVFTDLPFAMDIEFAPDGSYYLATFTGRETRHYSPSNELLGTFSDGRISDQLVFYAVPEPGSAIVGLAGASFWMLARRRSIGRA